MLGWWTYFQHNAFVISCSIWFSLTSLSIFLELSLLPRDRRNIGSTWPAFVSVSVLALWGWLSLH